MDNLISLVEKKNYTQALKVIESTSDIFKNISVQKRENLFETLDFKTYTLVIQGLFDDSKFGRTEAFLFNKFLEEFDPEQVKLRFKSFNDLCKRNIASFLEAKIAIKLVKNLQLALNKLTATDNGLTPLHVHFLKLCIQTKTYKQAIPVIQRAVTSFNKNSDINEEDIAAYFYYSGHILIALKQYDEAYIFLRYCLQLAQSYVYSSTLSAKKKLTLLLLRSPKLQYSAQDKKFKLKDSAVARYLDLSRILSADDAEVLGIFTKIYNDLVNDEKLRKEKAALEKFLTDNKDVFEEDKNQGLAAELPASFNLRKLKELKKVYQNCSLGELATILEVTDKEIIQTLIQAFAVKPIGRIDVLTNSVEFVKAKDAYRLQSLYKLHNLTNLLKQVSQEYNKEHEMIIRDRIAMPNTIFS